MIDFLDPNTWPLASTHEYHIYLDDQAQTWCVVDEVDYTYLVRWKWHINKPHPARNGKKHYVRRSRSHSGRYLPPVYLHVEVLQRSGLVQPSPLHYIADHRDGNEFNCRRYNLRWATPRMNRMNLHGGAPYDLLEDLAQIES